LLTGSIKLIESLDEHQKQFGYDWHPWEGDCFSMV